MFSVYLVAVMLKNGVKQLCKNHFFHTEAACLAAVPFSDLCMSGTGGIIRSPVCKKSADMRCLEEVDGRGRCYYETIIRQQVFKSMCSLRSMPSVMQF